jgi:hypothetical protein
METKLNKTTGQKELKYKRDSPTMRSPREIFQQGAGSSGATNEPAAFISAKGTDEPVVRNLPEVKPRSSLLGVSGTDIP